MTKLKTLVIAAVATVAVGATLMAGSALAATGSGNQDSLVDKLATKFNLNKDEVQKVFDEEHQAREAEHEKKLSEYLQTKVDDKTITAEQKTLLENKLKEMHEIREQNRDELKSMTHDERHEVMEKNRQEFKQWAEENNIRLEELKLPSSGLGHGHPHRHGR